MKLTYFMRKLKTGTSLIILGNLLYLSYIYFCRNETNDFGDFSSGLLLGLSIGYNLAGDWFNQLLAFTFSQMSHVIAPNW